MLKTVIILTAALALSGCMRSDTAKAQRDVRFNDKPAHITCQGYSGVMVDADTTGRIEFDETGRIDFVDAKSKRLIKTEGECVVSYFK